MKCIVAIALLAVVCSASATFLPFAGYSAYNLPYVPYAYAPHISLTKGIPAAPVAYSALPLSYAAPIAAPLPVPAPIAIAAPSATYVAQTRGATHVAPLPGHIESVASQNLQPAPGTL